VRIDYVHQWWTDTFESMDVLMKEFYLLRLRRVEAPPGELAIL
jgi:hypothetical protein